MGGIAPSLPDSGKWAGVACVMVYPRLFELIPVLFLGSMMDHVKNLQPLEWGFVYLERSDI